MHTVERFSRLTIVLHWLIAVTCIGLIVLGLFMSNLELFDYYELHKSIGIIVTGVILVRVVYRIKRGWPAPVSAQSKPVALLTKSVHGLLIGLTVLMPVTGMISSGASGHGFGIFAVRFLAENVSAANPETVVPISEFWSDFGQNSHEYLGYLFAAVIILHVAAALKHHFIDKDETLSRMLGKKE